MQASKARRRRPESQLGPSKREKKLRRAMLHQGKDVFEVARMTRTQIFAECAHRKAEDPTVRLLLSMPCGINVPRHLPETHQTERSSLKCEQANRTWPTITTSCAPQINPVASLVPTPNSATGAHSMQNGNMSRCHVQHSCDPVGLTTCGPCRKLLHHVSSAVWTISVNWRCNPYAT